VPSDSTFPLCLPDNAPKLQVAQPRQHQDFTNGHVTDQAHNCPASTSTLLIPSPVYLQHIFNGDHHFCVLPLSSTPPQCCPTSQFNLANCTLPAAYLWIVLSISLGPLSALSRARSFVSVPQARILLTYPGYGLYIEWDSSSYSKSQLCILTVNFSLWHFLLYVVIQYNALTLFLVIGSSGNSLYFFMTYIQIKESSHVESHRTVFSRTRRVYATLCRILSSIGCHIEPYLLCGLWIYAAYIDLYRMSRLSRCYLLFLILSLRGFFNLDLTFLSSVGMHVSLACLIHIYRLFLKIGIKLCLIQHMVLFIIPEGVINSF
jgi:hypothetical protein